MTFGLIFMIFGTLLIVHALSSFIHCLNVVVYSGRFSEYVEMKRYICAD
jgi:hypothetical protein